MSTTPRVAKRPLPLEPSPAVNKQQNKSATKTPIKVHNCKIALICRQRLFNKDGKENRVVPAKTPTSKVEGSSQPAKYRKTASTAQPLTPRPTKSAATSKKSAIVDKDKCARVIQRAWRFHRRAAKWRQLGTLYHLGQTQPFLQSYWFEAPQWRVSNNCRTAIE